MTNSFVKKYDWILFDADDTLFHFDAFGGLQLMFAQYNVQFTKDDYHEYQKLNKSLWVEYQNHQITAQELQHRRFTIWADKLQLNAHDLNSAFLCAMAEICAPTEGAVSLLNALHTKTKLGIITNGFIELQQVRLERTQLKHYFDIVVISEEVGVAKPHPEIFTHALDLMGNPDRKKVLMIGDNPHSDIIGAMNAGMDTCWLNVDNKPVPEGILPTYEVSSLTQLETLLDNYPF
jgi:putative hydrolase of the HAD superfamily/5'-nucleotidase